MADMCYSSFDTPIGALLLAGEGERLAFLGFPSGKGAIVPRAGWRRDDQAFGGVKRQLAAYFAGERRDFDVALAPRGTAFQLAVWQELGRIPFGETISYGELARRLGRPAASRAVGAANGANPIPILIPCHRVIGANGSLTGFGGGLDTKRHLLALERGGQMALL